MSETDDLIKQVENAVNKARETINSRDEGVVFGSVLNALLDDLQAAVKPPTARVSLFKPGGKWYTDEDWRIPRWVPNEVNGQACAVTGPYDMIHSPDFRRIDGGPVLVESQDPWGYPFLLMP